MCRHLAYVGPSRSLASLLYAPDHSLEAQSYKPRHQTEVIMNADGWGVGWWDHDVRMEPARYRTATPMWADRALRTPAELIIVSACVAAARAASRGSPVVDTGNAPFTAGPWLFSLNGYMAGYRGPLGEELRRSVSSARSLGIEGTADSEVLFSLLLDRIDGGATPADALVNLVADIVSRGRAKLNLLLSDGHTIVATAYKNSLFALADSGLAQGGVMLASEPLDDDPAWTLIPDESLVEASGTTVTISPLVSHEGPS